VKRNQVVWGTLVSALGSRRKCISIQNLRKRRPARRFVSCEPGPDLAGGRPGPSGVFGISERDWLSNYRVLKIEGFGGRPPVGGRPGARGPRPP